jgi:hypothetical protein
MRFLTYAESANWCSRRGYPTRQREGYIVGPEPDIQAHKFPRVEFALPRDSGRKVWLARFIYGLVDPSPELLIWLGDWGVWPSGQHMPLFSSLRQAFGEHRPLIEAPGHLVASDEIEDGVSILTTSLLFLWDCHVLTASGRDVVFVSHDEFGWFGSRDVSVAGSIGQQLKDALGADYSAWCNREHR